MLTRKPTITFDQRRLLDRWNMAITEAVDARDKAALRTLAKTITRSADAFVGADRARALALVARADACLRYLQAWPTWRGWRRWAVRHLTPRSWRRVCL